MSDYQQQQQCQKPKIILYVIKCGSLYATYTVDRIWYLSGRPEASAAAEIPPGESELQLIAGHIGVDVLELKVCRWVIEETEETQKNL